MSSKKILVVDDMAVFREPIAATLQQNGYKAFGAKDADEALILLELNAPDLMLLDVAMPGLDGISFLRNLRSHPRWRELPVIILAADAPKETVLSAKRLGVHGYMVKSQFSLDVLLDTVREALGGPRSTDAASTLLRARQDAADAIPALKSREQTLGRVREIDGLKALPGPVSRVLDAIESGTASGSELAVVLNSDPVLSARVIQVANQPSLSAGRGYVADMTQAIERLGVERLAEIVGEIGTYDAVSVEREKSNHLWRAWLHGFGVASIMDRLTAALAPEVRGVGHFVGLCHDVGRIVLLQEFPSEYREMLKLGAGTNLSIDEMEERAFGVVQWEIGNAVLAKIGLPLYVIRPIKEFFDVQLGKAVQSMSSLARLLRIANLFAHGAGLAANDFTKISPVTKPDLRNALGNRALPDLDALGIRAEALRTVSALTGLSFGEKLELSESAANRHKVRVWYARQTTYGLLDPLEGALHLLAHPRLSTRLPRDESELEDCSAVVVAVPRLDMEGFSSAALTSLARDFRGGALPVLCVSNEEPPAGMFAENLTMLRSSVTLHRLERFVAQAAVNAS